MNKKLLLLFFCFAGLTAIPLFGMKKARTFFSATKPFFAKQTIKNKYSQAWRNTITATKWGIAFTPTLHAGYSLAKKYFRNYSDPDPDEIASSAVTTLYRKELEKLGIKNADKIDILLHNQETYAAQSKDKKQIYIHSVVQAEIELNLLKSSLNTLLHAAYIDQNELQQHKNTAHQLHKLFDTYVSKEKDDDYINDDWHHFKQLKRYIKQLDIHVNFLYKAISSCKEKNIVKATNTLKELLAVSIPDALEGEIPFKHKELLHHEAAHLAKNHIPKTIASGVIIPTFTTLVSHLLPTKNLMWWKHLLYEPLKGVVLAATNKLLYYAYSRHQEQEADDAIENDLQTLQAAADCRRRWYENEEKEIDESKLWYEVAYNRSTSTHPSHLSRAQQLEKRIEILKKQQGEKQ